MKSLFQEVFTGEYITDGTPETELPIPRKAAVTNGSISVFQNNPDFAHYLIEDDVVLQPPRTGPEHRAYSMRDGLLVLADLLDPDDPRIAYPLAVGAEDLPLTSP